MKKNLSMLFIAMTLWAISATAQVNVKGYYRKDGTYVEPHVRTRPDNTVYNNYSYPGNYNPNKDYVPSTRTYQPTTTPTSGNYSGSYDMYKSTSTYIPPYSERTYVTDKKGRQTGMYVVTIDSTDMCIRKAAYSSSTDLIIGHITEYFDGDVWIYDNNGKLVKRMKPKTR